MKIGDKLGRLTILAFTSTNGKKRCLFKCDCGGQITMRLDSAKRKDYPSCGCWGKEIRKEKYADSFDPTPYVGHKFGRLLVTGVDSCTSRKERISRLVCLCDCGTQVVVRGDQLKSGATKSCGCLQKEWATSDRRKEACTKHTNTVTGTLPGGRTSIYEAWSKVRQACLRDRGFSYERVCHEYDPRWDSFEEFLSDFGQIHNEQTISRYNNKLPWSKENCFVNIGRRGHAPSRL